MLSVLPTEPSQYPRHYVYLYTLNVHIFTGGKICSRYHKRLRNATQFINLLKARARIRFVLLESQDFSMVLLYSVVNSKQFLVYLECAPVEM